MTVASLTSSYEITDESVGLLLHEVDAIAHPRSAQVALLLIAGATDAEIRDQLQLTRQELAATRYDLRARFSRRRARSVR